MAIIDQRTRPPKLPLSSRRVYAYGLCIAAECILEDLTFGPSTDALWNQFAFEIELSRLACADEPTVDRSNNPSAEPKRSRLDSGVVIGDALLAPVTEPVYRISLLGADAVQGPRHSIYRSTPQ